jgi:putative peptide zinc metalloprotease protein
MPTATAIPPRRRPDLILNQLGDGGEHVVKDPRTGAYFSLGEQEIFLLVLLDGRQSIAAVCAAFEQRFGEPLSVDDLEEFLVLAYTQGLLHQAEEAPPAPAPPPRTPLSWRCRLFDPDRLFTRLEPRLRFLWFFDFLAFSGWWLLGAAVLACVCWRELFADVAGAMRWDMLVPLAGTVLVATVLHEFAHGLTCKHSGGEVHEVGFLSLFFMPCFYCNVSDAWLFREKSKRLWVTLAGGYCDLVLCAAAVFVWRLAAPDGWPWRLALAVLAVCGTRTLFNLNPLLKLDGYYLLSDWLELPNLQQRSWDYLLATAGHRLERGPRPPAEARGRVLLGYGVANWLFSVAYLTLMLGGLGYRAWGYLPAALGAGGPGW